MASSGSAVYSQSSGVAKRSAAHDSELRIGQNPSQGWPFPFSAKYSGITHGPRFPWAVFPTPGLDVYTAPKRPPDPFPTVLTVTTDHAHPGVMLVPREVRLAAVEQIPEVHRIMVEAFAEYRSADVPSSALNETVESITSAILSGKEHAILCHVDNVPMGSGRFHTDDDTLYFSRLAVVPHARGTGIAKAMLAWLEAFALCHGKSTMWCRVRMSVPRNIQFYKAVGFDVDKVEEVINPNGFPVKTVVMTKTLSLSPHTNQRADRSDSP